MAQQLSSKPAAEKPVEFTPQMRAPGAGGPGPGGRMGGGIGFEKAKTANPRGVLWRWIFSYMRPYWGRYIAYFLLLLAGTTVTAVSPLITLNIIDNAILKRDTNALYSLITLYVFLMMGNALVSYIAQYGMNRIGQVVVREVRKNLFNQLQKMSMAYFDRKLSGDILSIMTNDVDQLNLLVSGQLVLLINNFIQLGMFLAFMYYISPILATLALINFPLFLYFTKRFQTKVADAFKVTRKTISRVTSSIQENIAGAKVVQAYGQEKKATKEFDEANQANAAATVRVRKTFATYFTSINWLTSLTTAGIIYAGGLFFIDQISLFGILITVGTLVSFITYLSQLTAPLLSFSQIQNTIESAMAASDRIYTLEHEEVELHDPENPVPVTDVKGDIDFKDVSFGYILEDNAKSTGALAPVNAPSEGTGNIPPGIAERGRTFMENLPEPYKSFILANISKFPPPLRQSFFMNLMGANPEEIPDKIDAVLGDFQFAVPGTDFAQAHPDYKNEFEESPTPGQSMPPQVPNGSPAGAGNWGGNGAGMGMPPAVMLAMAKRLENPLKAQANGSAGGSMGGGGGMGGGEGMGAGGMPQSAVKGIVQTLASMRIPPETYKQFPAVVRKAIEEQKTLMERAVSVGYVLEDLKLHVDAGRTLGVVGETGAGKTTLIRLIARFYDVNKGEIDIDGIDVRSITKKDLRRMIGLVPQDSFMFKGTIRENLLYGIENPSLEDDNKMLETSKFLGLHNFVMTLPEGYDTPLMENASNLSIGQRQLMAFARALITDPKILILDEATSSVDPYTETLIQDALDRARTGRTTIIIAHRLSTIKNADHIVVISREVHGIIEEGTHDELMAIEDGHYKKLVELQSREFGTPQ